MQKTEPEQKHFKIRKSRAIARVDAEHAGGQSLLGMNGTLWRLRAARAAAGAAALLLGCGAATKDAGEGGAGPASSGGASGGLRGQGGAATSGGVPPVSTGATTSSGGANTTGGQTNSGGTHTTGGAADCQVSE
jgi:hypothetical protein